MSNEQRLTSLSGAASASDRAGGGPAVDLQGIEKTFGETRALRGASLTARAGEIHAIVGENGSGKSTLAKIISGILPADAGTAIINGRTVRTPREAMKSRIATVFQEVLVAEGLSIADNIYLGLQGPFRRTMSPRQQVKAASELLSDLIGEPIDASQPVDDLTLAQRQWVTIARALVRDPSVIIFDESTAALDLQGAARLHREMERLRSEGACILIVTHRIAELTSFADRATVLRDGKDVGVLEGQEVTEDRLLSLMSGIERDPQHSLREGKRPDTRNSTPLLQADNVVLATGSAPSNFTVFPGEIVGLAGLDGQGQSEFIQVLTGVRQPLSGTVTAKGRSGANVEITSLADATHNGVGYISGDRRKEGIFPNLSIFENFAMPLYAAAAKAGLIDKASLLRRFNKMVKDLSLRAGAPTDLITSLSGGNQQKVLIGRVMAEDPVVVGLNDPARGVDIKTKRELYSQLNALADAGAGVVYLSTEIEELTILCDKIAVFRNGSLFGWLEGSRLNPDAVLAAMFGHLESEFEVEQALAQEGAGT